jgi:hypothetical protein
MAERLRLTWGDKIRANTLFWVKLLTKEGKSAKLKYTFTFHIFPVNVLIGARLICVEQK